LIQRRRFGRSEFRVDDVREAGERVAVALSWRTRTGDRDAWGHVVTVREGRIVDMQDYRTPADAMRALVVTT
jgi:hypothetical protein